MGRRNPSCQCCGAVGPCPTCGSVDWEWTEYIWGIDVVISGLASCLTYISGATNRCTGIQWGQLNGTYTYRVYSTGPTVSQVSDGYTTIADQNYIDVEVDYSEAGSPIQTRVYRIEFQINGTSWSFEIWDRGIDGIGTPVSLFSKDDSDAETGSDIIDGDCTDAGTCFIDPNEGTIEWDVCGSPWQDCGTTLGWRLISDDCTGTCLPLFPTTDGVTEGDGTSTCCADRQTESPERACCTTGDSYVNCLLLNDDCITNVEIRDWSTDALLWYQTGASWRDPALTAPANDCYFFILMTDGASNYALATVGQYNFGGVWTLNFASTTEYAYNEQDSSTCNGTDLYMFEQSVVPPNDPSSYALMDVAADWCFFEPVCIGDCQLEANVTSISSLTIACDAGSKFGQTFTQWGTAVLGRPQADGQIICRGAWSGTPGTEAFLNVTKSATGDTWVVSDTTLSIVWCFFAGDGCSGTISTISNDFGGTVASGSFVVSGVPDCPE